MLSWLNSNASVVSGIATAVSASTAIVVMFATLMTVALNRRLARENRELRKAEGDPQVIAYATTNPRYFPALDFVLANIGRGPAKNVSYKIVSGGEDLAKKGVRLLPLDVKFSFLLAGRDLSAPLGMGFDLLSDPPLAPFEVEVSYENVKGETTVGRHWIDVTQFDGLVRLGEPPDEQMADGLKKIAKVMESWSMSRLQVETMSVTERKEHDEQARKMLEERRKRREG
jgi:hypothetical protein